MYRTLPAAALAALVLPLPAQADDITDALTAAIEAYEAGDIQDALAETAYATQLLNDVQSEGLAVFLPASARPAGRAKCRTTPPPVSASWVAAAQRRPSIPVPAGASRS
jgi:hypothetical protein